LATVNGKFYLGDRRSQSWFLEIHGYASLSTRKGFSDFKISALTEAVLKLVEIIFGMCKSFDRRFSESNF